MFDIKRILVATDFSDLATHVLRQGEELARKLCAELLVVHVLDSTPYVLGGDVGYSSGAMLQAHTVALEASLASLSAELNQRGLRTQTYLEHGSPHDRIVQLAKTEKADLIMMGTHGRDGVRHVLMGSVAERVARLSTVPVLTFRAESRA